MFCKKLFFRSKLSDELHHLLMASVFKHWDAMVSTCAVNLKLNTHSVIVYVNQVLSICKIPKHTFDTWCKNTVLMFKLKNISALDYDEIKDLPEGATMDVRNFMSQQQRLINMVNTANNQLVTAVGTVVEIRDTQLKQEFRLNRVEANQSMIITKLDKIGANLEAILSLHHLTAPKTNEITNIPTIECNLDITKN